MKDENKKISAYGITWTKADQERSSFRRFVYFKYRIMAEKFNRFDSEHEILDEVIREMAFDTYLTDVQRQKLFAIYNTPITEEDERQSGELAKNKAGRTIAKATKAVPVKKSKPKKTGKGLRGKR